MFIQMIVLLPFHAPAVAAAGGAMPAGVFSNDRRAELVEAWLVEAWLVEAWLVEAWLVEMLSFACEDSPCVYD